MQNSMNGYNTQKKEQQIWCDYTDYRKLTNHLLEQTGEKNWPIYFLALQMVWKELSNRVHRYWDEKKDKPQSMMAISGWAWTGSSKSSSCWSINHLVRWWSYAGPPPIYCVLYNDTYVSASPRVQVCLTFYLGCSGVLLWLQLICGRRWAK